MRLPPSIRIATAPKTGGNPGNLGNGMNIPPRVIPARTILLFACALIITTYALMIDLKGISTDEGVRLAVINGGQPFTIAQPAVYAGWDDVLEANRPLAYQPLYYLLQNTLMRIAGTQNVIFFRLLNLACLGLCLQGLLTLSRDWRLMPRLFLLGLFAFNAYLFMHVLQIREYIAGVAFYIWSTWVVLELDRRRLAHPWADVAWFAGYGVLLTLGFYLQTWIVFPAIGQFLFLCLRRGDQRLRFYAHLALSYVITVSTTWPYLGTNQQKINIGLWASENESLWVHLADGFQLVLSGHLAGHSLFTDFLSCFWLAVIISGTSLVLRRKNLPVNTAMPAGEYLRQGRLMGLCIAVSLTFQLGYYYRVENLSLWPRYFVIHYFFVTWLVALVFKYLWDLRRDGGLAGWPRRGLTVAVGLILAMLTTSAFYQIRSYYRNPLLDTGFSAVSSWRNVAADMARFLRPADAVVTYDFINRSTLTFTRPIANPVLLLPELETSNLSAVERLVYLEPAATRTQRGELAARLQALGFPTMQEKILHTPDGVHEVKDWRVLLFERP